MNKEAPVITDIEFEAANKQWFEYGRYYGYPTCCIKHFCRHLGSLTWHQSRVHNGYGFIPCPYHAKKIYHGEITIESLITNRVCETEFPNA